MADLQSMLNELQEREIDHLEAKRSDLTEKIYPNLPDAIKRTAEVTGMSEEVLVRACVQAAWQYKDIEWHLVLDILRSVYLAKKRIEHPE